MNMGHMGGLINPRPLCGQYRAGFSNTGGSPKPQKRAPCQKKAEKFYESRPFKSIGRKRPGDLHISSIFHPFMPTYIHEY